MKKLCYLIFTLLLATCTNCRAFDIVYPKTQNVTINAKSSFFIGSSSEPLKINGQNVPLHSSGGFAYVVDLKSGDNFFTIESENQKKIYKIIKPVINSSGSFSAPVFKKYDVIKSGYVINDKSPLRSTPVDAGINRIAHLQRNIMLNFDGEKGGFYRVVLSDNKYGWIAKTNIKLCENYNNTQAILKSYEFEENKNYYEFIFHFDKTVPYEIVEGNPMTIKFYGVQENKTCSGDVECSHKFAISSHIENGVYSKDFSITHKLIGYSGKYIGNDFVWKIRKSPVIHSKHPLKHLTVTVDAGHGGSEAGAIGCLGNKEKDTNLEIAKYLEEILKKRGAEVIMTRSDDTYLGLQDRVDISNYSDASVFISIHGNALPDGTDPNKKSGVGIYYYYNQSKDLAETILNTMVNELQLNDDKIHQASFAVVRNTNALSVLIETAYLINPSDDAKLVNPEFQKQCAKAIADGLESYFLKP